MRIEGTNSVTVQGGKSGDPAIGCSAGTTLVIDGTGSLYAFGAGDGAGLYGSGGHIIIAGGNVTARSGANGAGIGGGGNYNSNIRGGLVEVTGGTNNNDTTKITLNNAVIPNGTIQTNSGTVHFRIEEDNSSLLGGASTQADIRCVVG
jgi:hypothetical protein